MTIKKTTDNGGTYSSGVHPVNGRFPPPRYRAFAVPAGIIGFLRIVHGMNRAYHPRVHCSERARLLDEFERAAGRYGKAVRSWIDFFERVGYAPEYFALRIAANDARIDVEIAR